MPQQLIRDVAPLLARAVETGTYRGDGAILLSRYFSEVVTVEVSPALAAAARRRLAGLPGVQVVAGDSAAELWRLARPNVPTLYFLDAHACKDTGGSDCPILDELDALAANGSPQDVVVIDDLRVFNHPPADRHWPSPAELERHLRAAYPRHAVMREGDHMVAVPRRVRLRLLRRAAGRRLYALVTRRTAGTKAPDTPAPARTANVSPAVTNADTL